MSFDRRKFNQALAAAGTLSALAPFGIVRAQQKKLKVGVLLPLSGVQGFIGQSCKKGVDLAPEVMRSKYCSTNHAFPPGFHT